MTTKRHIPPMAIVTAVVAGSVAAGVAYLLYVRPQWRKGMLEFGRYLLSAAENVIHHPPVRHDGD